MSLYNVVYQLIRNNDCVIIPGFGGFVANYSEAKVDFNIQEFYPPEKKIAFNKELSNNDGLLINHIANVDNIEWIDADNIVKSFVKDIKSELEISKHLEFGKLGKFSLTNDILVFKPNLNLNLLDESFGLESFSFPMIGNARTTIEIQKPKKISKTKSAKLNKKKGKIRPVVFYVTSAAVIVGLLFVAVKFDLIRIENEPKYQVANIAPVDLVDSSSTEQGENINSANNKMFSNTVEEETILELNVEQINENETNDDIETIEDEYFTVVVDEEIEENTVTLEKSIHIIGGSFSYRTNAEVYQNELISKGFDSKILPTANGMFRVSVKSFSDNTDAVAELNSLRNQTGNSSLWVLNW